MPQSWHVRSLCCALASLALLGCGQVRVDAGDNRITHSNFHFVAEHWQEPRLRQLRDDEDLGALPATSELELLSGLCDWTHRQWPHSRPAPWPLDNAIDILRDIRSGKTGGWCGQYAYVFVDVAKALGFFCARYVELADPQGSKHFVAEVWVNQLAKWVVFDPDYNVFFRRQRDGVAASALEVRDAAHGGPGVVPVVIHGGPLQIGEGRAWTPEQFIALYRTVAVSMRADLMRHRQSVGTSERQRSFVLFDDGRDLAPYASRNPYTLRTARRQDLEFDCNTLRVEWRALDRDRLQLQLLTDASTPNFKGFVLARAGAEPDAAPPAKGWEPCAQDLLLQRSEGDRDLWLAPINQLDRRGVARRVRVAW